MDLAHQHIVAAFKKGDEKATKIIFSSFFRPLCYFNEKILGNRQVAEDIATESFIKLCERKSDFTEIAGMRSFLFVVAKNACIDFLRRNRSNVGIGDYTSETNDWDEGFMDREIIVAKVLQVIYAEIELLPEQCKRVFTSIFIGGKTTQAIAHELNISPQTVLNQKTKALNILRIKLNKTGYAAGDLLFYCLSLMAACSQN